MEAKIKLAFVVLFLAYSEARVQPPPPPPVTADILHQVANSLQMFVDELPKMPKLYGFTIQHGSPVPAHLTIGMFQKKWKFHRDLPATTVFAFGTSQETATVPGPTIESLQGTPTFVTWENHLPRFHILPWDRTVPTAIPKTGGVPVVVHLHGGVHEPQSDGSALAWFTAGFRETGPAWSKSTYKYLNVQHAGNLWYHDHALGLTRINILAGLIGAYIIRNPAKENPLNLPSGEPFDQHLVIFDRSFLSDGSLYINRTGIVSEIHPQWQPEYFGDAIIVNGKAWPFMKVQRRKYRFRIINAGNARYYQLSLSDGLPFTVIGSDASYLAKPVFTDTLLLSPSEIADVIIDFSKSKGKETVLSNAAPYPYPSGDPVDSLNSKVMKFIIIPGGPNPADKSNVPAQLFNYASVPNTQDIKTKRYIVMYEYTTPDGRPTHLYINGRRFEDPVTETPRSGSTEIWEVINLTGDNHPLHIHLGTSQAVRIQELVDLANFTSCMQVQNDAIKCNVSGHATGKLIDVTDYEMTWKNAVKMAPGYVTTIVVNFHLVEPNAPYPFDATAEPGYVYHCHILDHEDNAMIRPLKLAN
ncbi:Leucine permease transcriptional regulator [Asimina triloba]